MRFFLVRNETELAVAEDPLRPHDHDDDQEQREEHHPVLRELAQPFRQGDVEHGAEDRARDRAQTADHDHDDDLDRLDERERVGVEVHQVVPEEAAADARHRRGHDEGDDLAARRVHAHRLRRDLVLADRDQRPPERGVHDAVYDEDRQGREEVDPEEVRELRDAGVAARSPDRVDVQDEDADDLAEAERHDGEVVPAQPQRRHAHEEPRDGRQQRPHRETGEQDRAVLREARQEGERRTASGRRSSR